MKINGIHHVSMKCNPTEFEKAKEFYLNVLNLKVYKEWDSGIMIETPNGIIEIFHNGENLPLGTIRHFAFSVSNLDLIVDELKNKGYKFFVEPKDINLNGLKAKIAFFFGPLGEEIELFCEYEN